jgi:hypothetical protein
MSANVADARFLPSNGASTGQRPETLEFLGFRHVCGADRVGRFALIRIPDGGPVLNETPLDTERENSIHKCLMLRDE